MKNDTIFVCDFDGTITKKDTINDFLDRFADKKWIEVEEGWVAGRISTCDAMRSQFSMIKGMTREVFDRFFETVEIDDYFEKFCELCKEKGYKVVIVSDGFEYFIRRVLAKYSINDIEIYSNYFDFNNGNFIMEFPYKNNNCKRGAGTCKCSFIEKFREKYEKIIYIGDGASDFCPSSKADFLFAKKKLLEYCKENNIPYVKYSDFNEVINHDMFKE